MPLFNTTQNSRKPNNLDSSFSLVSPEYNSDMLGDQFDLSANAQRSMPSSFLPSLQSQQPAPQQYAPEGTGVTGFLGDVASNFYSGFAGSLGNVAYSALDELGFSEAANRFKRGTERLQQEQSTRPWVPTPQTDTGWDRISDSRWWRSNFSAGLGSSAAFALPSSAVGAAIAPVAGFTAAALGVSTTGAAAISFISGVLGKAGVDSLLEASMAYSDARKEGKSQAEANKIASQVSYDNVVANLGLEVVTGGLGMGAGGLVRRIAGKSTAAELQGAALAIQNMRNSFGGQVAMGASKALWEGVEEGIQERLQGEIQKAAAEGRPWEIARALTSPEYTDDGMVGFFNTVLLGSLGVQGFRNAVMNNQVAQNVLKGDVRTSASEAARAYLQGLARTEPTTLFDTVQLGDNGLQLSEYASGLRELGQQARERRAAEAAAREAAMTPPPMPGAATPEVQAATPEVIPQVTAPEVIPQVTAPEVAPQVTQAVTAEPVATVKVPGVGIGRQVQEAQGVAPEAVAQTVVPEVVAPEAVAPGPEVATTQAPEAVAAAAPDIRAVLDQRALEKANIAREAIKAAGPNIFIEGSNPRRVKNIIELSPVEQGQLSINGAMIDSTGEFSSIIDIGNQIADGTLPKTDIVKMLVEDGYTPSDIQTITAVLPTSKSLLRRLTDSQAKIIDFIDNAFSGSGELFSIFDSIAKQYGLQSNVNRLFINRGLDGKPISGQKSINIFQVPENEGWLGLSRKGANITTTEPHGVRDEGGRSVYLNVALISNIVSAYIREGLVSVEQAPQFYANLLAETIAHEYLHQLGIDHKTSKTSEIPGVYVKLGADEYNKLVRLISQKIISDSEYTPEQIRAMYQSGMTYATYYGNLADLSRWLDERKEPGYASANQPGTDNLGKYFGGNRSRKDYLAAGTAYGTVKNLRARSRAAAIRQGQADTGGEQSVSGRVEPAQMAPGEPSGVAPRVQAGKPPTNETENARAVIDIATRPLLKNDKSIIEIVVEEYVASVAAQGTTEDTSKLSEAAQDLEYTQVEGTLDPKEFAKKFQEIDSLRALAKEIFNKAASIQDQTINGETLPIVSSNKRLANATIPKIAASSALNEAIKNSVKDFIENNPDRFAAPAASKEATVEEAAVEEIPLLSNLSAVPSGLEGEASYFDALGLFNEVSDVAASEPGAQAKEDNTLTLFTELTDNDFFDTRFADEQETSVPLPAVIERDNVKFIAGETGIGDDEYSTIKIVFQKDLFDGKTDSQKHETFLNTVVNKIKLIDGVDDGPFPLVTGTKSKQFSSPEWSITIDREAFEKAHFGKADDIQGTGAYTKEKADFLWDELAKAVSPDSFAIDTANTEKVMKKSYSDVVAKINSNPAFSSESTKKYMRALLARIGGMAVSSVQSQNPAALLSRSAFNKAFSGALVGKIIPFIRTSERLKNLSPRQKVLFDNFMDIISQLTDYEIMAYGLRSLSQLDNAKQTFKNIFNSIAEEASMAVDSSGNIKYADSVQRYGLQSVIKNDPRLRTKIVKDKSIRFSEGMWTSKLNTISGKSIEIARKIAQVRANQISAKIEDITDQYIDLFFDLSPAPTTYDYGESEIDEVLRRYEEDPEASKATITEGFSLRINGTEAGVQIMRIYMEPGDPAINLDGDLTVGVASEALGAAGAPMSVIDKVTGEPIVSATFTSVLDGLYGVDPASIGYGVGDTYESHSAGIITTLPSRDEMKRPAAQKTWSLLQSMMLSNYSASGREYFRDVIQVQRRVQKYLQKVSADPSKYFPGNRALILAIRSTIRSSGIYESAFANTKYGLNESQAKALLAKYRVETYYNNNGTKFIKRGGLFYEVKDNGELKRANPGGTARLVDFNDLEGAELDKEIRRNLAREKLFAIEEAAAIEKMAGKKLSELSVSEAARAAIAISLQDNATKALVKLNKQLKAEKDPDVIVLIKESIDEVRASYPDSMTIEGLRGTLKKDDYEIIVGAVSLLIQNKISIENAKQNKEPKATIDALIKAGDKILERANASFAREAKKYAQSASIIFGDQQYVYGELESKIKAIIDEVLDFAPTPNKGGVRYAREIGALRTKLYSKEWTNEEKERIYKEMQYVTMLLEQEEIGLTKQATELYKALDSVLKTERPFSILVFAGSNPIINQIVSLRPYLSGGLMAESISTAAAYSKNLVENEKGALLIARQAFANEINGNEELLNSIKELAEVSNEAKSKRSRLENAKEFLANQEKSLDDLRNLAGADPDEIKELEEEIELSKAAIQSLLKADDLSEAERLYVSEFPTESELAIVAKYGLVDPSTGAEVSTPAATAYANDVFMSSLARKFLIHQVKFIAGISRKNKTSHANARFEISFIWNKKEFPGGRDDQLAAIIEALRQISNVDQLSSNDKTARAYETQIAILEDLIDKEQSKPNPDTRQIVEYGKQIKSFENALDALKKSGAKSYLNAPSISVMQYVPEISSFGGMEVGGRIFMNDADDKTPEVVNDNPSKTIEQKQKVIILEGFSGRYRGGYDNGISNDSLNSGAVNAGAYGTIIGWNYEVDDRGERKLLWTVEVDSSTTGAKIIAKIRNEDLYAYENSSSINSRGKTIKSDSQLWDKIIVGSDPWRIWHTLFTAWGDQKSNPAKAREMLHQILAIKGMKSGIIENRNADWLSAIASIFVNHSIKDYRRANSIQLQGDLINLVRPEDISNGNYRVFNVAKRSLKELLENPAMNVRPDVAAFLMDKIAFYEKFFYIDRSRKDQIGERMYAYDSNGQRVDITGASQAQLSELYTRINRAQTAIIIDEKFLEANREAIDTEQFAALMTGVARRKELEDRITEINSEINLLRKETNREAAALMGAESGGMVGLEKSLEAAKKELDKHNLVYPTIIHQNSTEADDFLELLTVAQPKDLQEKIVKTFWDMMAPTTADGVKFWQSNAKFYSKIGRTAPAFARYIAHILDKFASRKLQDLSDSEQESRIKHILAVLKAGAPYILRTPKFNIEKINQDIKALESAKGKRTRQESNASSGLARLFKSMYDPGGEKGNYFENTYKINIFTKWYNDISLEATREKQDKSLQDFIFDHFKLNVLDSNVTEEDASRFLDFLIRIAKLRDSYVDLRVYKGMYADVPNDVIEAASTLNKYGFNLIPNTTTDNNGIKVSPLKQFHPLQGETSFAKTMAMLQGKSDNIDNYDNSSIRGELINKFFKDIADSIDPLLRALEEQKQKLIESKDSVIIGRGSKAQKDKIDKSIEEVDKKLQAVKTIVDYNKTELDALFKLWTYDLSESVKFKPISVPLFYVPNNVQRVLVKTDNGSAFSYSVSLHADNIDTLTPQEQEDYIESLNKRTIKTYSRDEIEAILRAKKAEHTMLMQSGLNISDAKSVISPYDWYVQVAMQYKLNASSMSDANRARNKEELKDLREQLDEAKENEDYELQEELNDQIMELRSTMLPQDGGTMDYFTISVAEDNEFKQIRDRLGDYLRNNGFWYIDDANKRIIGIQNDAQIKDLVLPSFVGAKPSTILSKLYAGRAVYHPEYGFGVLINTGKSNFGSAGYLKISGNTKSQGQNNIRLRIEETKDRIAALKKLGSSNKEDYGIYIDELQGRVKALEKILAQYTTDSNNFTMNDAIQIMADHLLQSMRVDAIYEPISWNKETKETTTGLEVIGREIATQMALMFPDKTARTKPVSYDAMYKNYNMDYYFKLLSAIKTPISVKNPRLIPSSGFKINAEVRVKFDDNVDRDLPTVALLFAPEKPEERSAFLDSLTMRGEDKEPIALSTELTPAALRLRAAAVQAGGGMLSSERSAARDPSRRYAKEILGWHDTFLNPALSPEQRISNFNSLINKIAELIKSSVATLNTVSDINLDPEEEFINAVALLTTAFTPPRWQNIIINNFLLSPSNKNIAAFTAFTERPTFAVRNRMAQRLKAAIKELNDSIGDKDPAISDLVGESTETQELYTPYRKYLATLNQAVQTAVEGLPHAGEAGSRKSADNLSLQTFLSGSFTPAQLQNWQRRVKELRDMGEGALESALQSRDKVSVAALITRRSPAWSLMDAKSFYEKYASFFNEETKTIVGMNDERWERLMADNKLLFRAIDWITSEVRRRGISSASLILHGNTPLEDLSEERILGNINNFIQYIASISNSADEFQGYINTIIEAINVVYPLADPGVNNNIKPSNLNPFSIFAVMRRTGTLSKNNTRFEGMPAKSLDALDNALTRITYEFANADAINSKTITMLVSLSKDKFDKWAPTETDYSAELQKMIADDGTLTSNLAHPSLVVQNEIDYSIVDDTLDEEVVDEDTVFPAQMTPSEQDEIDMQILGKGRGEIDEEEESDILDDGTFEVRDSINLNDIQIAETMSDIYKNWKTIYAANSGGNRKNVRLFAFIGEEARIMQVASNGISDAQVRKMSSAYREFMSKGIGVSPASSFSSVIKKVIAKRDSYKANGKDSSKLKVLFIVVDPTIGNWITDPRFQGKRTDLTISPTGIFGAIAMDDLEDITKKATATAKVKSIKDIKVANVFGSVLKPKINIRGKVSWPSVNEIAQNLFDESQKEGAPVKYDSLEDAHRAVIKMLAAEVIDMNTMAFERLLPGRHLLLNSTAEMRKIFPEFYDNIGGQTKDVTARIKFLLNELGLVERITKQGTLSADINEKTLYRIKSSIYNGVQDDKGQVYVTALPGDVEGPGARRDAQTGRFWHWATVNGVQKAVIVFDDGYKEAVDPNYVSVSPGAISMAAAAHQKSTLIDSEYFKGLAVQADVQPSVSPEEENVEPQQMAFTPSLAVRDAVVVDRNATLAPVLEDVPELTGDVKKDVNWLEFYISYSMGNLLSGITAGTEIISSAIEMSSKIWDVSIGSKIESAAGVRPEFRQTAAPQFGGVKPAISALMGAMNTALKAGWTGDPPVGQKLSYEHKMAHHVLAGTEYEGGKLDRLVRKFEGGQRFRFANEMYWLAIAENYAVASIAERETLKEGYTTASPDYADRVDLWTQTIRNGMYSERGEEEQGLYRQKTNIREDDVLRPIPGFDGDGVMAPFGPERVDKKRTIGPAKIQSIVEEAQNMAANVVYQGKMPALDFGFNRTLYENRLMRFFVMFLRFATRQAYRGAEMTPVLGQTLVMTDILRGKYNGADRTGKEQLVRMLASKGERGQAFRELLAPEGALGLDGQRKAGKLKSGVRPLAQRLAAQSLGLGAAFLGAGLAAAGLIDGPGPDDDKEYQAWLADGHRPWTMAIGKERVNPMWFIGPLAWPLFFGVIMHDAVSKKNVSVAAQENLMVEFTKTLGTWIINNNGLNNFGLLFNAFAETGTTNSFTRIAAQQVFGRNIPYSSFVKWMSGMTDAKLRSPQSFLEYGKLYIPGGDDAMQILGLDPVTPKYDQLFRERTKSAAQQYLSPFVTSSVPGPSDNPYEYSTIGARTAQESVRIQQVRKKYEDLAKQVPGTNPLTEEDKAILRRFGIKSRDNKFYQAVRKKNKWQIEREARERAGMTLQSLEL